MNRRHFLKSVGVAGTAGLLAGSTAAEPTLAATEANRSAGGRKTWLFWDWWHVEHQDNVELRQGEAAWQPQGTYEDPTFDYLGCWPTVWRDETAGTWRMVYFGSGFPLTLLGAESDDGVRWRPMDRSDVKPPGEKYAPNHLFSVPSGVVLHTLRKDGFTYLASRGNWASLTTKPLALLGPELTLNAAAPYGEISFQATDLKTRPLEGFTFEDCVSIRERDSLRLPVRWKDKDASELVGKVIRLQVRFRNARIYALRGAYHFLDALDVAMIDDGKRVDTSLFDF